MFAPILPRISTPRRFFSVISYHSPVVRILSPILFLSLPFPLFSLSLFLSFFLSFFSLSTFLLRYIITGLFPLSGPLCFCLFLPISILCLHRYHSLLLFAFAVLALSLRLFFSLLVLVLALLYLSSPPLPFPLPALSPRLRLRSRRLFLSFYLPFIPVSTSTPMLWSRYPTPPHTTYVFKAYYIQYLPRHAGLLYTSYLLQIYNYYRYINTKYNLISTFFRPLMFPEYKTSVPGNRSTVPPRLSKSNKVDLPCGTKTRSRLTSPRVIEDSIRYVDSDLTYWVSAFLTKAYQVPR
jgi:hypothetical protein